MNAECIVFPLRQGRPHLSLQKMRLDSTKARRNLARPRIVYLSVESLSTVDDRSGELSPTGRKSVLQQASIDMSQMDWVRRMIALLAFAEAWKGML